MQCFVINLPKDKERRESISKELKDANVSYSIMEAVNGAELVKSGEVSSFYDEEKAIRIRHRKITPGELGCALSHMKIYRTMVEQDIPYAVVMEDDVEVREKNLPAVLAGIKNQYSPMDSTIIILGYVGRYVNGKNSVSLGKTHMLHDYYRGGTADCYVITQAAAKNMPENLFPVFTIMDKWEFYKDFVDVKAIVPYCAFQKAFPSSIEEMSQRSVNMRKNRVRNLPYYLKHYGNQAVNFFTRQFMDIRRQPF